MTLERAMRQVLAELQLLQYGKTQSFNAAGGRSENPDPPGWYAWSYLGEDLTRAETLERLDELLGLELAGGVS